jgi:hypothetical protein
MDDPHYAEVAHPLHMMVYAKKPLCAGTCTKAVQGRQYSPTVDAIINIVLLLSLV